MQSLHTKKSNTWIIVLIIVLLILVVNPFKVGDNLRGIIGNLFNPITAYGTKVGRTLGNTSANIGRLTQLESRRQELQDEVSSLKTQIAQAENWSNENKRLRNSLNLVPKHKYNLLGADVIGYDLHNAGEWIMINRGRLHGVKSGAFAIINNEILVGQVSEVFDKSSRIQLVTSKKSVLGALDAKTTTKVIVSGGHGLAMLATEIPRDLALEVGTTLLSIQSESAPNIKDLGVGIVKEVIPSKDNLTQRAVLEPLFSPNKLTEVYIITSATQ